MPLHQLEAYLHLAAEPCAWRTSCALALARARAMDSGYEEDRLLCAICEVAQWAPSPGRGRALSCAAHLSAGSPTTARCWCRCRDPRAAEGAGRRPRRRTAGGGHGHTYTGDLHLDLADAAVLELSGLVESLAGDHGKAEEYYRRALDVLRAGPRTVHAPPIEAEIARELLSQDRAEAAQEALDRITSSGADLGLRTAIAVSSLSARIAARRGGHEEALSYAGQAMDLSEGVDDLRLAAETLFSLSIVQRNAGMPAAAASSATAALDGYVAKGAALPASRVQDWLDSWPVPAAYRMTEPPPWRRPRRAHFPGVPAWGSPVARLPDEPFEITELGPVTGEWAWGGADGAGVRVCLLDSGVDPDHPRVGSVDRRMEVVTGRRRRRRGREDRSGRQGRPRHGLRERDQVGRPRRVADLGPGPDQRQVRGRQRPAGRA